MARDAVVKAVAVVKVAVREVAAARAVAWVAAAAEVLARVANVYVRSAARRSAMKEESPASR